jgi:nucleoside-diphosphate-sugar epimerase
LTPFSEKSALVTGAAGFVGSHLVRRLLAGGWTVHAVDQPGAVLLLLEDVLDRITLKLHDGATESLQRIVEQSRPNVVFHLASLFLSQHGPGEVEPLIRSNVLLGAQLLEAMKCSGCVNLVNTGTSWQHGTNGEVGPVNLYAATKQAFEELVRHYADATPLRAVTLKLFDTYGPCDPRPKLFTLLRRVAATGEPLEMSPGEQLIDLVYIDDVVDAFLAAAELLLAGTIHQHECYAVSSGAPLRLRDLVGSYGRITGNSLSIRWGGRPYREREVMVPWNNGRPVPGWRARVGLEQGIRLMEGLTSTAFDSSAEGSR